MNNIAKGDLQRLKILSDKTNYNIFNEISKSRNKVKFSELVDKIKIDRNELSVHIAFMVDFNLLQNSKTDDIYLSLTDEAKSLIERIDKNP